MDFAIGAVMPGSLILEEMKYNNQEKITARLRGMPEEGKERDYLTIITCDLASYLAEAGTVFAANHYDSDKLAWLAAGIATFRGLSKVYQASQRRHIESENSFLRNKETTLKEMSFSRLLPGR